MSDFSADWLAQREAIEATARSVQLSDALCRGLARESPLKIVDLATGTGANLRYLAPRLGGQQEWLLVDQDAKLISELPNQMCRWAKESGFTVEVRAEYTLIGAASFECRFRLLALDLATKLYQLPLQGSHLTTASALLDLVSLNWLDRLVARCQTARTVVLFVLTYDGRIVWTPADDDDEFISELVNRHQRTDKGFGAALGPTATQAYIEHLTNRRYLVHSQPSEWRLGPQQRALQLELLQGWAQASLELQPESYARIQVWTQRRRAHIRAGRSSLIVGHADVLGWPAGAGVAKAL